MGDRKRRLSRAIDALALRVEHGALLAATDPAALLESACDRIASLESRLADVERERDAALAELDGPETCDHCGDPCVDYRQRNGERWCIGCVSVDADARVAALEARLAEVEREHDAAIAALTPTTPTPAPTLTDAELHALREEGQRRRQRFEETLRRMQSGDAQRGGGQ